jgi:glutaryl-CoA dehydrogenase
MPQTLLGLFGIEPLISDEDRAVRDTVRRYVKDRPKAADRYETGTVPAGELVGEPGSLGMLAMRSTGYGCAGTSATATGGPAWNGRRTIRECGRPLSVQGTVAMEVATVGTKPREDNSWPAGGRQPRRDSCQFDSNQIWSGP